MLLFEFSLKNVEKILKIYTFDITICLKKLKASLHSTLLVQLYGPNAGCILLLHENLFSKCHKKNNLIFFKLKRKCKIIEKKRFTDFSNFSFYFKFILFSL